MMKEEIIQLVEEIKVLINSWSEWVDSEKYENLLKQMLPKSFEKINEEESKMLFNSLLTLKEEIIKYDKYLVADKSIELDMDEINLEYIEKETVMVCVNKILKILSQIEEDKIRIEKSEDLVLHFYNIAYNLMKKELLLDFDSIIYNFISGSDDRRKIIEYFIKEDYELIKQLVFGDELDDKKICETLFKIDFDKDGNLFDKELIRLIAKLDDNNKNHIENVNKSFDNCISTIKDTAKDLQNKIECEKNNYESLDRLKKENIRSRELLTTRVASMILTLSVFCGYFLGNINLSKNKSNYKYYNGSISSYSSYDDSVKTRLERFDCDSSEDSTLLKVYSKTYSRGLFNLSKRTVSTYDVTDLDLSDYEDYINLDLNNLDYDIKEINYTDDVPEEEYREVVKTSIDKSKILEDTDVFSYYVFQLSGIFIMELLCDIISFIRSKRKDKNNQLLPGMAYNLKKIFTTDKGRFASLYSYLKNYDKEVKLHEEEIQRLNESIDYLLEAYNNSNSYLNTLRYKYECSINDGYIKCEEIKRIDKDVKLKVLSRKEK